MAPSVSIAESYIINNNLFTYITKLPAINRKYLTMHIYLHS